MDLLKKFAAVEIKADNRITEADRAFCEKNQAAYEAAIQCFKELAFFWNDMNDRQTELLSDQKQPFFHNYLSSEKGPSISQEAINRHIESLHASLVKTITRYFNTVYHVSVPSEDILSVLIPKEPDRWKDSEETVMAYHTQMRSLVIQYQDIVEQLILRLDGRGFAEQAFHELFVKCHSAAWNTTRNEAKFERKKDTIQFKTWFCSFDEYLNWSLSDGMRNILFGAAHFETGCYDGFPAGLSNILKSWRFSVDIVELSACKKLRQFKLFKNGRVDLKFTSESYAEEFVSKYLGTTC